MRLFSSLYFRTLNFLFKFVGKYEKITKTSAHDSMMISSMPLMLRPSQPFSRKHPSMSAKKRSNNVGLRDSPCNTLFAMTIVLTVHYIVLPELMCHHILRLLGELFSL